MESISRKIKEAIYKIKNGEIIVAKSLYNSKFKDYSENLFYKTLERLTYSNNLKRIGKGIYIKPKVSRFGELPISEEKIIEHFTNNNSGVLIGYSLYNSKGLTTQTPSLYKVLSNNVNESNKTIRNVNINKIPFKLNKSRRQAIELLDIIENCRKIEDLSYENLKKLINEYIKEYNNNETEFIISNKKYKKSTIASLKYFLDKNGVKNTLSNYLSSLSKYNVIKI